MHQDDPKKGWLAQKLGMQNDFAFAQKTGRVHRNAALGTTPQQLAPSDSELSAVQDADRIAV